MYTLVCCMSKMRKNQFIANHEMISSDLYCFNASIFLNCTNTFTHKNSHCLYAYRNNDSQGVVKNT